MSFQTRKTFIFRTQIKICMMKCENSLTLHRLQHNCNIPRSRNVARTSVKQSMWHQWLNFSFAKLREYSFCAQKTKMFSTILLAWVMSSAISCYVSGPGNIAVVLLSMEGQKALTFHHKYLNLCSEDERRSYRFGTTWGWVINDRIFILGVN